MRSYVLVAGGLQEPEYLGSTATFTLGAFAVTAASACAMAMC